MAVVGYSGCEIGTYTCNLQVNTIYQGTATHLCFGKLVLHPSNKSRGRRTLSRGQLWWLRYPDMHLQVDTLHRDTATHFSIGSVVLHQLDKSKGGRTVAVAGQDGFETRMGTCISIPSINGNVIDVLMLRLMKSSGPLCAKQRQPDSLAWVRCEVAVAKKGGWKAKRNTVRLCTNDTIAQQQLPLLLPSLQHGKVAELLLWWVLVWSSFTEEFLE